MHVLFDLDGTLTDSSPGIVRCINHALEVLGRPAAAEECLRPMIGAPLSAIFSETLQTDDVRAIDAAIAAYRDRFNAVGMFENSVFPGIIDALDSLRRAGHSMQIVTVKPAVAARRIVEHFRLASYFAGVHGPDLTERTCDKADLVAAALREFAGGAAHVAMVGDRADDIRAAQRHAIRAVAAGWGYGTHDELVAAGPEYVAPTVAHLVAWVHTAGQRDNGEWRTE